MSKLFSSRFAKIMIAAVACIFAIVFALTLTDGIANANTESTPTSENSLVVGHISDIHYFPYAYSYHGVANENFQQSDFYDAMTGDTKMVLESGQILSNNIKQILADADTGLAPKFLFATGDLSKNSERVALIDVANSLRWLQNEMRKKPGYENFQVFASPGNHDQYNRDAEIYEQTAGKGSIADSLNSAEFALIFAGLGYPNASLDGKNGTIKLTDYLPESYWYSSFTSSDGSSMGYQESTNILGEYGQIHYFFDTFNQIQALDENTSLSNEEKSAKKLALMMDVDDTINILSFVYEIKDSSLNSYSFMLVDSSDRHSSEEEGALVRIGEYEFNAKYASPAAFATSRFHGEDENGIIDGNNALTLAQVQQYFAEGKNVYRDTKLSHLTGGRLTEDVLDFLQQYTTTQTDANTTLGEETYVVTFHQNALPHFEQQDDILKDFTIYNWESTTKRLLSMGVRYALTGHMHSSDVMTYTDAAGRTLFDLQIGSSVSYQSPRRYITLDRFDCDGKLGETFNSSVYTVGTLKEAKSDHVYSSSVWNQAAFDTKYNAYKTEADKEVKDYNALQTAWEELKATNPDFEVYMLQYEKQSVLDYNQYINGEIYSQLLERVISHVLKPSLLDSLTGMVTGLLSGPDAILPSILQPYGEALSGLASYVLDTLIYNLYPNGYEFGNEKYDDILGYLNAVVDDLLNISFGDETIVSSVNPENAGKLKLKEIASFIMVAHADGTEINLIENKADLPAEYAAIDAQFDEVAYSSYPAGYDREFRFKHPLDATYRKRMTAAVSDIHQVATSGQLVQILFDKILNPLYFNDNSLLKTLLNYEFNLSAAKQADYFNDEQYEVTKNLLGSLPTLIPTVIKVLLGADVSISMSPINPDSFTLGAIIDDAMPLISNLLASLIGFNLDGDTLDEALTNVYTGYVTDSFKVGLGGIADTIIMAYATDINPDVADMLDFSVPYMLQRSADEDLTYGGMKLTYVSTKEVASSVGTTFNPATQENGRVPSRVTAHFDNANYTGDDESTTYTIQFYTAEEVYGRFKWSSYENPKATQWKKVETSYAGAVAANSANPTDYFATSKEAMGEGIVVTITTETKPQYIPLIDLGLAALTHGEVSYEDANGNEIPYVYGDRDKAEANSVIYWNVHTVTIKIPANVQGQTFYYDIEGVYADGREASFSLAKFSGVKSFSFKAQAPQDTKEFEFLTIADIQGMIEGMYLNSYQAVEALLQNDATKNFNFVLNAGDMCDNGKNFYQWGWALNTYQPLFANTAHFFTAGNHEGSSTAMTDFFNYTLPTNPDSGQPYQSDLTGGIYYSFDYGNAHFVVLNTNDADEKGLGATQLKWLQNDLKASTEKWKFVLMHKSLFSGGSHSYDAEVVAMREQLVPIFAQYGVSMVFAGHDHTYTSTYMLNGNGDVIDAVDAQGFEYAYSGTMYITLGTLGTKFYTYGENENVTPKFDEEDSILGTLTTQTFGKVKVTENTIVYTGYKYDGNDVVAVHTIKLNDDATNVINQIKQQNSGNLEYTLENNNIKKAKIDESEIYDASSIPSAFSVVYLANDTEYARLRDVKFDTEQVVVSLILKDSAGNVVDTLKTITIIDASYSQRTALLVGIPVGIVLVIVLIILAIVLPRAIAMSKYKKQLAIYNKYLEEHPDYVPPKQEEENYDDEDYDD